MSDSVDTVSLVGLLDEFDRVVGALQDVGLTSTIDADLLEAHRRFERTRRRLDPAEYRLIAEENQRKLPAVFQCRSTGQFLRHLLKVDPGEANARARAAAAAGPRTTLIGEQLEPIFEHVAAAQQAGDISQRHALILEKTIDELPDAVTAVQGDEIEQELVGYASNFDPKQFAILARRLADYLDPDGTLDEPDKHEKRRAFTIRERADGSSTMTIEGTPEFTARMRACLDTFAAPRPAINGVPDPRSLVQRQHDAFLGLLELAQRAADAPSNNGVSMTIVIYMTLEQYLTGTGLARTNHGALVPVSDALSWSGGDAEVIAAAINSMGAITHYGNMHRIFTENQRRVMAARDGGCTFPGCPEPPGRCQADHIVRHEHDGPTSVDNGQLRCRYHHRLAERFGYTPIMINGRPHWIPPKWIDPAQKPVRNTLHDIVPAA